jgi:hypothetical protein
MRSTRIILQDYKYYVCIDVESVQELGEILGWCLYNIIRREDMLVSFRNTVELQAEFHFRDPQDYSRFCAKWRWPGPAGRC